MTPPTRPHPLAGRICKEPSSKTSRLFHSNQSHPFTHNCRTDRNFFPSPLLRIMGNQLVEAIFGRNSRPRGQPGAHSSPSVALAYGSPVPATLRSTIWMDEDARYIEAHMHCVFWERNYVCDSTRARIMLKCWKEGALKVRGEVVRTQTIWAEAIHAPSCRNAHYKRNAIGPDREPDTIRPRG